MQTKTSIAAALLVLSAFVVAPMAAGLSTTHNQTVLDGVTIAVTGDPGEEQWTETAQHSLALFNSIWAPFGISNAVNTLVIEPFGVSLAGVLVTDVLNDGVACPSDGEIKFRVNDCAPYTSMNNLTKQPFFHLLSGGSADQCEAVVDLDPNGTGPFGYDYAGDSNPTLFTNDPAGFLYPTFAFSWSIGLLSFFDEGPMMVLNTTNAAGENATSWQSFFTYEGLGTAHTVHYTTTLISHDCVVDARAATDPEIGGLGPARPKTWMRLAGHETGDAAADPPERGPFKDPSVFIRDHTVYTI